MTEFATVLGHSSQEISNENSLVAGLLSMQLPLLQNFWGSLVVGRFHILLFIGDSKAALSEAGMTVDMGQHGSIKFTNADNEFANALEILPRQSSAERHGRTVVSTEADQIMISSVVANVASCNSCVRFGDSWLLVFNYADWYDKGGTVVEKLKRVPMLNFLDNSVVHMPLRRDCRILHGTLKVKAAVAAMLSSDYTSASTNIARAVQENGR
jgi:hypothetical protein